MISVAIVEDDKFYNNTLKRVLDMHMAFSCVAQLFSGAEALSQLPVLRPDIVLMDLNLKDYSGSDVIKQLNALLPGTTFVVITSFQEEEKVFDSLRGGAAGYLVKGESLENIVKAIHDAHNGGVPMSKTIGQKVLKYFRGQSEKQTRIPGISNTELQVLAMMAKGQQYKEIASNKNVSVETIKKHVSNIYRKLGVNNKVEAINYLRKYS